ncbi:MAG: hypothetical protein U1E39_06695 [Planctomycetota bacterium]
MTSEPSPTLAAVPAPTDLAAATAVLAPTLPVRSRARARLVVAALAIVVWMLPWRSDGRTGPELTGAPALLAFVAVWGLAAGALLARTRRGLLVGEAVTSAAFAVAMTALVTAPHPWLPPPDRSATCLPIFAPLAALGLLDAASRLRRPPLGGEVAVIRAVTALLCAGALFVAWDPLPAAAALWLGVAPLAAIGPSTARGARRALEAMLLVACVALFLSPELHPVVAGAGADAKADVETGTPWPFVFWLLVASLAILSGRGVLLPEGDATPSPS